KILLQCLYIGRLGEDRIWNRSIVLNRLEIDARGMNTVGKAVYHVRCLDTASFNEQTVAILFLYLFALGIGSLVKSLYRGAVIRRELELDGETVLVGELQNVVPLTERSGASANICEFGIAFPISAKKVIKARAQAAFEIRHLFFCLNLDQFLVTVKDPTCIATIGLHGLNPKCLKLGSLLIRKNDDVNEGLKRHIDAALHQAEFPVAYLRRHIFVAVPAKQLNRLLNDGLRGWSVRRTRLCESCPREHENSQEFDKKLHFYLDEIGFIFFLQLYQTRT